MKYLTIFLTSVASAAARAHESLGPHDHPHGLSMLPGLDSVALGAVVLAAGLVLFLKFGRR